MIGEISHRARRDRYGSKINRTHSPVRAYVVPWLSIMLASLVPMIPIASAVPLVPPLGFLMLLSWRLVRPGLMPVWAGVPLGIFDDVFSGQPFGSAIMLWSATMIAIEIIETRFPWRGFFQDWAVSGLLATVYLFVAALFSGGRLEPTVFLALLPQIVFTIVLIPVLSRVVSALDRFRLSRVRGVD
jgi:rod shape-determining protein MreD